MLSKCIGIISWFPDNNLRNVRIKAFEKLLSEIYRLFGNKVDIVIIAQNWQNYLPKSNNKLIIYSYPKGLGILPARKVLREKFLELGYDYLIMLDDDCIFKGTTADDYLKEIDEHPNMIGLFTDHLLKLLAISHQMYTKLPLPEFNAEKKEGFEDKAFIQSCMNKYPEYCYWFKHTEKLDEISYGYVSPDYPSTWWNSEMRRARQSMIDNTDNYINSFKGKEDGIDVVVTWVQPTKRWEQLFETYSKKNGLGRDRDANAQCRYRDWGIFKYWFRALEKNVPWINRVYLLLQDEDQIPSWLNLNHPKVKIVYHDEYIPEELLPTFNSNTIELFIPHIKQLSNRYILCNDDTYFWNKLSESDFYRDGKPVTTIIRDSSKWYPDSDNYKRTLNNNMRFIENCIGRQTYKMRHLHMVEPRLKNEELRILDANFRIIIDSLSSSKFRDDNNVTQYIYSDILKYQGKYIDDPAVRRYSDNVNITRNLNLNILSKYKLVCINDNSKADLNERKALQQIMENKFPQKSGFEL